TRRSGRVLQGDTEGSPRQLNPQKTPPLGTLWSEGDAVFSLGFNERGTKVVCMGSEARAWDWPEAQPASSTSWVNFDSRRANAGAAFSNDLYLAVLSRGTTRITIHAPVPPVLNQLQPQRGVPQGHRGRITCVAIRQFLATGGADRTVK